MFKSTSETRARFSLLLAAVGLLAGACSLSDDPTRPDILLITVDTLRADALGAYGADEARTPRIDQLAADGTVYERAVTPMPMTRPAHFSLFTACFPEAPTTEINALSLPEDAETLPERLQEAGYRTGAFVGVHLLSPATGAGQGFDTFGDVGFDTKYRAAGLVVDEALDWLSRQPRSAPVFLWVHLFDPHLPYEPPSDFIEGADEELAKRYPNLSWRDLRTIARSEGGNLPGELLDYGLALYRAEVAYTDFEIGRLVDGVDQRRGLDDTVVALTADHGECFERGIYFEHADCLYRGSLRIPLILRHPSTFAAGHRADHPVSLLDLAPTLLSAVQLPAAESFRGEVLSTSAPHSALDRQILIQYPLYQPRTARSRSRRAQVLQSVAGDPVRQPVLGRERVGLVGPDWKYIRMEPQVELFSEVGNEENNLAAAQPEVAERLEGELDMLLKKHPLHVLDPQLINEELRQTLEALGYIVPPEETVP